MTPAPGTESRSWRVEPADAGQRLDVFLAARCPELSRSAAAREIRAGRALVLGRAAKPSLLLRAGEEVGYRAAPPEPATLPAQALPLEILYEDDDLAVVVKPAGLVTHPAPGHPDHTLVNALVAHFGSLSAIGGRERPGLVHRLDKDTSGLMLVAKNDATHRQLAAGIAARAVQRRYDAVVWGGPRQDRFEIRAALGRDPRRRQRLAVVASGGRDALTRVEVARRWDEFSLLALTLATGRTHQIRLHCRHVGLPVVGDRTYGRAAEGQALARLGLPRPGRQLLHARALKFRHPRLDRELAFEAPWPADFAGFVRALETRAAARR